MNRNWVRSFVGVTFAVLSCRGAANTFLDLPPAKPGAAVDTVVVQVPGGMLSVVDTVRPPIEFTLDPDSVVALLPRDHAGNIDWMAALRERIIKPRSSLPGDSPALGESRFEFAFDFYLPGPDTLFDAFFPHSAHTEWADCRQCHGRIFRYQDTKITMGDIFQGRFCGECHGKVAYPVTTGCERCHRSMTLPPDRAQPDLLGTITMRRVTADSAVARSDTIGNAAGVVTTTLPVARFPHWVHRIRYRCKVCHMDLFEPKAGANAVLMQDIADGKSCGACHDGNTAFRSGFTDCIRCHVDEEAAG